MSNWILPGLSVLLLIGVVTYDNLDTIEAWGAAVQSVSSTMQTPSAVSLLANNWGLALLVVVILFVAVSILARNAGASVESENGKAMRYQSHRYLDVEIIR